MFNTAPDDPAESRKNEKHEKSCPNSNRRNWISAKSSTQRSGNGENEENK